MALIAIASDKGAPGVTTAALALAAVWPRPVLLAECDPSGGDLAYRFPSAGGGHLDPRRGVLSLAVTARRGMQPNQVWEHVQKLYGGLDVLVGVTNAEQGAGLNQLWGPIGKVLARLPQADVIADCGRLGADGSVYDLLVEANVALLVTKTGVGDVIRLRDRAAALTAAAESRGRRGFGASVLVVADSRKFAAALGEVQHVLRQAGVPAKVIGGVADDQKGAALLSGGLVGKVGKTMLIKTARNAVQQIVSELPPTLGDPTANPANPANPANLANPSNTANPGMNHPGTSQAASHGINPVSNPQGAVPANVSAPATALRPVAGPSSGQAGHRQGRHHAGQQQSGPVAALPPPPSGARHAQASPAANPANTANPGSTANTGNAGNGAANGSAESGPRNWAGAERLKWRQRERQQSGGV